MTDELSYHSPTAFRQAVTSLAENAAKANPARSKRERMDHLAYTRLLARLFASDDSGWVLKGGIALLARLPVARHSTDLDVARRVATVDGAINDLRQAASIDLGDFFDFTVENRRRELTGAHNGASVPVTARIGGTVFSKFNVDIVCGLNMTGDPDVIEPLQSIDVPGLSSPSWFAYPLVDHIADKLAAIYEKHSSGSPSTRYRDLVDLTLVLIAEEIDGDSLRIAIASEFRFRGLTLPDRFAVPDPPAWRSYYDNFAGTMNSTFPSFEEACSIVDTMCQCLHNIDVPLTWNPVQKCWN